MAITIIPTEYEGAVYYSQRVTLDGADFIMEFFWNASDNHWFLTLMTVDAEIIKGCAGIRLVEGLVALTRVRDDRRPAGEIVVVSGNGKDPTKYTLGNGSDLMYIDKADADDLRNQAVR